MRDARHGLAPDVPVVWPLVAALPGAHLVMHVDVSHLFVQRAKYWFPSGHAIVGMSVALFSRARLPHRPGSGRSRGRVALACAARGGLLLALASMMLL